MTNGKPPVTPALRWIINGSAFLAGFILGTVVFNNVGLGIVFGVIFSGGNEAARITRR